jgi:phosphoglycerate dehydrogenase-like enzyme
MTLRLVMCSPVARESFDRRLGEIDGVSVRWTPVAGLPAAAREADAIVLSGTDYGLELAQSLAERANPCRWVQLLSAGYELLQQHGVPSRVAVSNAGSVWSPIVAEHAMALMLAVARRVPALLAAQARREWDHTIRTDMSQLIDTHLVIVGMGSIGVELARRARAFGMRVTGVTRRGQPHPDADAMLPVSRLREALAEADYVAVAVPLSDATCALIGAAELAACPRHAVLVNVGRGPVVDGAALERALAEGSLAGAGLDVTDPEPLPPSSALWRMPNVVISPHLGGAAPDRYYERLVRHVAGNVAARVQGRPLKDRIELEAA